MAVVGVFEIEWAHNERASYGRIYPRLARLIKNNSGFLLDGEIEKKEGSERERWWIKFPNMNKIVATLDGCNNIFRNEKIGLKAFWQYVPSDPAVLRFRQTNRKAQNTRFELSTNQRENLSKAFKEGLFEYPRGTSYSGLAEDVDTSHSTQVEIIKRGLFNVLSFYFSMFGKMPSPLIPFFYANNLLYPEFIVREQSFIPQKELSKPENDDEVLTVPQFQAIYIAHTSGYYNIRRQIDLPQISAALGVSKSSAAERLHRGERKIVFRYLQWCKALGLL